jgi:NADH-quinone oxidoreductase subunit L
MTFHGKERFVAEKGHAPSHADQEHKPGHLAHAPHESPWVVTLPLILLAIPSVIIGWITAWPVLFGGWLSDAIKVAPANDVLGRMAEEFGSAGHAVLMSVTSPTLYLALAGAGTAWFLYLQRPELPGMIAKRLRWLYLLLANKFYFDELYVLVFSKGTRGVGRLLWQVGDVTLIDGAVNGTAKGAYWFAGILRRGQSGYLYHYAFAMIIGLCLLLGWLILK